MIVLYKGRRGAGKTTSMIHDAYMYKLKGWTLVTNMGSLTFADMVLPNNEILELLKSDMSNFVIAIDEIQTFIDSRRSMRGENLNFTYFIQQIRKRNVHILATTQYIARVDKAFREHIDIIAMPQYHEQYPVMVVKYVDLTIIEEGGDPEEGMFSIIYNPEHVFELFDTSEVIKPVRDFPQEESEDSI